jgi:hypothetical protein
MIPISNIPDWYVADFRSSSTRNRNIIHVARQVDHVTKMADMPACSLQW